MVVDTVISVGSEHNNSSPKVKAGQGQIVTQTSNNKRRSTGEVGCKNELIDQTRNQIHAEAKTFYNTIFSRQDDKNNHVESVTAKVIIHSSADKNKSYGSKIDIKFGHTASLIDQISTQQISKTCAISRNESKSSKRGKISIIKLEHTKHSFASKNESGNAGKSLNRSKLCSPADEAAHRRKPAFKLKKP